MKITVVGIGYVGLSNAALLAQHNEVVAVDLDARKVELVNEKRSPLLEEEMERFLANEDLNLVATVDAEPAVKDSDFVIIATPTDYDEITNYFDTSSVESVISMVARVNPDAAVVIKSTIPVGFTEEQRKKHPGLTIIFSPEFLREGQALHDNLHPSRIIVGDTGEKGHQFAELLLGAARDKDVPVLFTNSTEAEAVKLFANTYLAVRVAYFNELDTYAAVHGLNTGEIIKGVALDPRIGDHYNNPSFGYGGYCLPKDTKQLQANYADIPQNLITAVVTSNASRKEFLTEDILKRNPKTVGVHRLVMKSGSDNFRLSSIRSIMEMLQTKGVEIILYEPLIEEDTFEGYTVVSDIDEFKERADVILTNRNAEVLEEVAHKVYTRDVFNRD